MPINRIEKQLADDGVLGNLPRIGKLRKGGEKGEKSPGKDLDFFRLTLEPQYESIRHDFEQLYTTTPTEFHNVLLASDSADSAFTYWYETWAHAKLVRRCDGDEIVGRYIEGSGYDATHLTCSCNDANRECKQHGYMDIVLPDLCNLTGTWGKITLVTTSLYDVIALRKCMIVAGAFMNQLPNVSFWSVPFTIGRAPQNVPVTINGKRSIKNMSLIYAHVEPEFNRQVFTPLLTRPAQMLLAGVNPDTGEMPALPEITIEQTHLWDYDYVVDQTLYLFDHPNHQYHTIVKLMNDGVLTNEMTDEDAIAALIINRTQRDIEKTAKNAPPSNVEGSNSSAEDMYAASDEAQQTGTQKTQSASDSEWTHQPQAIAKLIFEAQDKLGLNHGQVIEALRYISPDAITNIDQFTGTKQEAWAACIAKKCSYNPDEVRTYLGDNVKMAGYVIDMMELHEIPF